jgi:hypothetical protein
MVRNLAEREKKAAMLTKRIGRITFWTAVVLGAFNTASAIAGGIGILVTGGLGMPERLLANGPFTSFTLPGFILLIVVGGTQLVSTWLLLAKNESALVWTAVAGCGLVIWIFVETGIIAGLSWLQVLYFMTGGAQLIAVIALLGVVAWLPRRPLRERATA